MPHVRQGVRGPKMMGAALRSLYFTGLYKTLYPQPRKSGRQLFLPFQLIEQYLNLLIPFEHRKTILQGIAGC